MAITARQVIRRNIRTVQNVAVDREYTVTYVTGKCYGECCRKVKPIRAMSRSDARSEFSRKFPLADIVTID